MLRLHVHNAVHRLQAGGVVAYPTEGVWGLGCDPLSAPACAKLLLMKRRAVEKGLILIAHDLRFLTPYFMAPSRRALGRAKETWPGPVTWLFPASELAPDWIVGAHATIAVRVTAHPVAAALCGAWGGALVSTSANRGGLPPARCAAQVRLRFRNSLDALVPGPLGGLGGPTGIRDAASGHRIRA